MLVGALVIALAALAWLVIKRMQHADHEARATGLRWMAACLGAALAVRLGLAAPAPLRVALGVLALAAVVLWLRRRGQGGDGRGDDGRDPPVDPSPDPRPGHRAPQRPDRLDPDAFDRARAEWEQALKKNASD